MNRFHFFVFSYNRGQFLANCVRSIEECSPDSPITIIDDQSDDAATCDILEALSAWHRVIRSGGDTGHKHGGLYANMQVALEMAPADELCCFAQDDTQLVRRIQHTDLHHLADCFDRRAELAFVTPAFLKGISLERRGGFAFHYDPELRLYFPQPGRRSAGIYYSDVFIARAGRLRSADWRFATGEPANQAAAGSRFGPMGYLRCPFLMWLPNSPAYRGRTRTLTLRLAERTRRCGLNPIRYMTGAETHRLESANCASPPVAEEWLTTVADRLNRPWIYDPLHGSRTLKQLNRLELLLLRLFRAVWGALSRSRGTGSPGDLRRGR